MVPVETTLADAVTLMKKQGSDCVLVGDPGNALGIVTEADIVRKIVASGKDPDGFIVDQIMSAPLISVEVKTPIYEIYRTMADHHIRHLLVTDGGKQIGFVSMKELIAKPIF